MSIPKISASAGNSPSGRVVQEGHPTSPGSRSLPQRLHVDVTRRQNAAIVTLDGELDLETSPLLTSKLHGVSVPDVELVVLDLRGLDFMDSTGLVVLIQMHQRAREGGQRFAVVNGGIQVQKLLRITRVADSLTLIDTPDELLPK